MPAYKKTFLGRKRAVMTSFCAKSRVIRHALLAPDNAEDFDACL